MFWHYLKERKGLAALGIVTIGCFAAVLALYHMELWDRLAYAAILAAFFWLLAAGVDFYFYCKRRNAIERLLREKEKETTGIFEEFGEAARAKLDEDSIDGLYQEVIGELHDSLWENREAFRARTKEQMDYYVMWAHQIKTPIAALRLLLDSSEDSKGAFAMREELARIEQYVEMVLCYQRLGNMAEDTILKEENLSALVKEAVRKLSVSFINTGIHLELSEMEEIVLTDEKWLAFCIEQILTNALKYTAAKMRTTRDYEGKISIATEASEKGPVLVIRDNGVGIRQEDLPRIFERGFTGYNGRADKKATGIGLFLTKQILDRLGNTITVESKELQGTTVRIFLIKRETILD